ncbi:ATP-dependent zinc protease family protein [Tropicimonas sediminicola]|nr:RimK/LysX family protein [Tropicimonas sediminicola]
MTTRKPKSMIGWRETVSLPDLGLMTFRAKIDTGALTTALHASGISRIEVGGKPWVEFLPDHGSLVDTSLCRLPILHSRKITNTSGIPDERYIVATTLQIGEHRARIEVSLADRTDMTFPIIIGRSAMRLMRLTVDPARSWLQSPRIADPKERQDQ